MQSCVRPVDAAFFATAGPDGIREPGPTLLCRLHEPSTLGGVSRVADAERTLGSAKAATDRRGAAAYLMQALADYRAVGNPRGQVGVYLNLGNLFSDGEPAKARDFYTKSLALSQSIGDESGVASAEADIAIVLWGEGDRDSAEAAMRRVLQIRRGRAAATVVELGVRSEVGGNRIHAFRRFRAVNWSPRPGRRASCGLPSASPRSLSADLPAERPAGKIP